jgi:hypothetical protein
VNALLILTSIAIVSEMVFIPDNPPERQYACPKCHKGVKCFRIGNSSSYLVMNADDEQEHDCEYKGSIDIKLVGYRPPAKRWENDDATKSTRGV